jgi:hypothetical protein
VNLVEQIGQFERRAGGDLGVVGDWRRLVGAGEDLDHLAPDHALGDDLSAGVRSDEGTHLAIEAQAKLHLSGRRGWEGNRLDEAGVATQNADPGADFDASNLRKAGADVKGVLPEPLPGTDGEEADGRNRSGAKDRKSKNQSLPATE